MSDMTKAKPVKLTKHEAALRFAISQIGVHEQPAGSNTGPEVRKYQKDGSWLSGTGWPWCFPEGTLVDTPEGFSKIEELQLGDWVLSASGTPRRVIANMQRLPDRCVRVVAQGVDTVTTPEHPYLVKTETGEDWVPAGELKRGDRIMLPARACSETATCSVETAYLLGRYVADGWTSSAKRANASTRKESVYICDGHDDADEVAEALESAGIGYYRKAKRTSVDFEMYGGKSTRDLVAPFGGKAHEKRVPGFVFDWPEEHRSEFLRGYTDGDGSPFGDGGIKATTVSRELAVTMTRLARTLGYATTLRRHERPAEATIEGRTVTQRNEVFEFSWGQRPRDMILNGDGSAWSMVRALWEADPCPVFNLTVEDEHTYIADGAAVHNCAAFFNYAVQVGGFQGLDRTAGAWDALARAQRKGWSLPPADAAKVIPGDGVVFNTGSGHIAVVERIKDGVVFSIDGNASDQVKRCERPMSSVRGFIAWPEDGIQVASKRVRLVQVVGGESGRRKLVVGPLKVRLPSVDKIT